MNIVKVLYLLVLHMVFFVPGRIQASEPANISVMSGDNTTISTGGLLTEGFENWQPSGWSFISPDGGKGWTQIAAGTTPLPGRGTGLSSVPVGGGRYAVFAAPFTGGLTGNDQWMISPAFTVSPGDSLFFWMTAAMTYLYADKVEIRISVSGKNTADFTEILAVIDFQAETINPWKKYRFDLSRFSGQTIFVAWRETVADNRGSGAFVMVDMVRIGPPAICDVNLLNLSLPRYLPPVETSFSGTFLNSGNAPVEQLDINWQVDEGSVQTTHLSGLSIASDKTYIFTCQDKYSPTPGIHSVKVWISNVNGTQSDENTSNNLIFKTINVASGTVPSQPVLEEFTSSTCMPCASFNSTVMLPIMELEKVHVIKYQMNFPLPGDKYYNNDGEIRRQFYGVLSVPTLMIGGIISEKNYGTIDSRISSIKDTPGLISIKSRHSISQLTRNIEVKADILPYFTESGFKVCIAVVEKKTTGNTGNNGETEFRSVLMKMIPDGKGTAIDLEDNMQQTLRFTADLYDTKTEDFNDLEVIVLVQNLKTREIYQTAVSEKTDDITSSDLRVKTSGSQVFPNPSGGKFTLVKSGPATVTLIGSAGNVVFEIQNEDPICTFDVSYLEKGIYLLPVRGKFDHSVHKVVIK